MKLNCSNLATVGELGEFPLLIGAWVSTLAFWHRSTQMPENTLVKKALKFLTDTENVSSEWLDTVKLLMARLNLNDLNLDSISTAKFREICKNKLEDLFRQGWFESLNNQTGSLRFYKTFKQTFAREKYLENLKCFNLRKIITKFRCSDHQLEIEKGRHGRKIPEPSERICQLCKISAESEIHLLAECPLYQSLRTKFLGPNVTINVIQIMQCNDKGQAFNLVNFLNKSFERRTYMLRMRNYFK